MTHERILSSVTRDEFVGRDAELQQIVDQAARGNRRGLVLLAAPRMGAAELLRQAYDQLFSRRGDSIPVHFAFERDDTLSDSARNFFQSFIQQYIAYRRIDPALCEASLTLRDLNELALPSDYELITGLIQSFENARQDSDQRAFLRFCLTAPKRLTTTGRRVFPLIDSVALARGGQDETTLEEELAEVLTRSGGSFALAGLRRHILDVIHTANEGRSRTEVLHLERLNDEDARRLVESAARRNGVESNEPTRDLIVQQFNGSPFLINALVEAARETKTQLTSFLNCQRLYVDELMGGRVHRYFESIIEAIVPQAQARKTLFRVLYESAISETKKASLWAWKKRLGFDAAEFEHIIDTLHVHELANSSAAFVDVNADSYVWMDYLRAHYRAEVSNEPRALIVSTMLLETLKRAPHTMARKYRREAALGLRELISRFNCQEVPASLFHYDRFAAAHKGVDTDSVNTALDAESDLIRLPQIVHATSCAAYSDEAAFEDDRCSVGHGFDAAEYTDDNEVVWLAAEIDSKLEATSTLVEEWLDRLGGIARERHFRRVHFWLVSPEGFSAEASALLNEREAYGSSRRQVELLTARIKSQAEARERERSNPDEFEMVIPMAADTELIAAHAVEQIARRVNFRPDAINQIKTALVEACINAAEHSLSPDRKIYQRVRVEKDKLIVTVASRGVVPADMVDQNGITSDPESGDEPSRRGWGLKLIRTLMDEVEFERVDDGTRLRMTKYLRN